MWAMGLILYELFTGEFPFLSQKEIRKNIRKPLPDHVPIEVEDLLSRLLVKDPEKRMTSKEVQRWLFMR